MTVPNINSPLVSLAALGISTFLMGGYLGGAMARKQEVKEEIKEIQAEHRAILLRIDSVYRTSVAREQKSLEQMDAIYTTLTTLTAQEGKTRTNISEATKTLQKGKEVIQTRKEELKQAASSSGFIVD